MLTLDDLVMMMRCQNADSQPLDDLVMTMRCQNADSQALDDLVITSSVWCSLHNPYQVSRARQAGQRVLGEAVASGLALEESKMWAEDFKVGVRACMCVCVCVCGGGGQCIE